ncbi:hypothetical protein IV203_017821 [Nitzschia inconspicua]|uniref:Uncharacterized protein n=1 Tax=Nitzschia inconspicua TaxID=303405 RepID=A0A9K3Q5Y2_9STRA|nr:hypothetical protein IV203_020522 [Nitzschia inconspicua]KAG7371680.1 hypothetical protein IV203_017821 [Nitzschia inconspicua]
MTSTSHCRWLHIIKFVGISLLLLRYGLAKASSEDPEGNFTSGAKLERNQKHNQRKEQQGEEQQQQYYGKISYRSTGQTHSALRSSLYETDHTKNRSETNNPIQSEESVQRDEYIINRITTPATNPIQSSSDDPIPSTPLQQSFLQRTLSSKKKSELQDFQQEWHQLDPNDRFLAAVGMIVAFLICWCLMTCLCNCLRACCFGNTRPQRHQYTEIDSMGRRVVYRDSYVAGRNPNRPCLNLLWGACCFELICRDNQDVDCCQLCCPLMIVECCCPP